MEHLKKKNSICWANLEMNDEWELLSEETACELDLKDRVAARALSLKGHRRHFAEKPCVQAFGPLPLVLSASVVDGNHHPLGIGRSYGTRMCDL